MPACRRRRLQPLLNAASSPVLPQPRSATPPVAHITTGRDLGTAVGTLQRLREPRKRSFRHEPPSKGGFLSATRRCSVHVELTLDHRLEGRFRTDRGRAARGPVLSATGKDVTKAIRPGPVSAMSVVAGLVGNAAIDFALGLEASPWSRTKDMRICSPPRGHSATRPCVRD
jgi:hypothetical protein